MRGDLEAHINGPLAKPLYRDGLPSFTSRQVAVGKSQQDA